MMVLLTALPVVLLTHDGLVDCAPSGTPYCPPSACIPDNRILSASAPGVPFNSLSCPFFSKHVDFANAERDHCLQAGFVWEDRTPSKRSDQ